MLKAAPDFMARSGPHSTRPVSLPPKIDVAIEKLVYGGEGLARHEAATVFVPFVLPGERVTVEPAQKKKNFIHARLDSVVETSPERITAACPHFGVCGGCDY